MHMAKHRKTVWYAYLKRTIGSRQFSITFTANSSRLLAGLLQHAESTKRRWVWRKTQKGSSQRPSLKKDLWKYTSRPTHRVIWVKDTGITRAYKAQAWRHTQYNSFSDSFILPPPPFLSPHSLLLFSLPLATVGGIRGVGGGAANDDNAASSSTPPRSSYTHTHTHTWLFSSFFNAATRPIRAERKRETARAQLHHTQILDSPSTAHTFKNTCQNRKHMSTGPNLALWSLPACLPLSLSRSPCAPSTAFFHPSLSLSLSACSWLAGSQLSSTPSPSPTGSLQSHAVPQRASQPALTLLA